MLYRTIKRLIERGETEGLRERIDLLFALGRLTEDEYKDLIAMLPDGAAK